MERLSISIKRRMVRAKEEAEVTGNMIVEDFDQITDEEILRMAQEN